MNIELKNISKFYGSLKANDLVSLIIPSGKIMGILGENGAGKSTLMKILSGLVSCDDGAILVNGKEVAINSPKDAIQLGIGMLHQEPRDFPSMSILDNFLLGFHPMDGNNNISIKELRTLAEGLGFNLDFTGNVSKLTVGERQELELVRLLYFGFGVLILDEPTTGISLAQKNQLFNALHILAKNGKSILFVSHKLDEIQSLCDEAAIMRKGKLVKVLKTPLDQKEMVRWMFGKEIYRQKSYKSNAEEVFIKMKNLRIEDFRINLKDVNVEIRKGEVIGIAGMAGSGQKQFLKTAAGLMQPMNGFITLNEKKINGKNCFYFQQAGIHFVPSDRLEEGLLCGMTIEEHYQLVKASKNLTLSNHKAEKITDEIIELYKIKGMKNTCVEELSGGNQQRMLLSMIKDPASLLLLEEPTRGLDIDSAAWVWSLLRSKCQAGTSIIFSSADLDELLFYSDRIIVFFSGEVSSPIPVKNLNEAKLGAMIGGKEIFEV